MSRLFRIDKMYRNIGGGAISAIVYGKFEMPESIPKEILQTELTPDELAEITCLVLVKEPPEVGKSATYLAMDFKNRIYPTPTAIFNPLEDKRDAVMIKCGHENVLTALKSVGRKWIDNIGNLREISLGRGDLERTNS